MMMMIIIIIIITIAIRYAAVLLSYMVDGHVSCTYLVKREISVVLHVSHERRYMRQ
jgi:hypothetical protein